MQAEPQHRKERLRTARIAGALALVYTLGACAPDSGAVRGFDDVRVVQADAKLRLWAGSNERFGFGGARTAASSSVAATGPAAASDDFVFDKPNGWSLLASSAMRGVNLAVTREPRAECFLTLLGGTGGGLAANVDRWRGQMGLAPLDEARFAALERTQLLGKDAVRIDFEGRYSGMDGVGGEDFRMVGLLAVHEGGSAFVKFVGPAAVVAEELAAFDAFAASLRVNSPAAAAPNANTAGFVWTVPEGWTRSADRPLRTVTFVAEGEVECYVAVLAGDGGGVRSNLDRWRAQMGGAPLTVEELAALEHVPALGVRAALIEVEGNYRGMNGETVQGGALLGAVAVLADSTVFVKMIGPLDAVRRETDRFRAFVTSLEVTR